jgi:micrococcal nuclease
MFRSLPSVLIVFLVIFLFLGFYDFGANETIDQIDQVEENDQIKTDKETLEEDEAIVSRVIDGDTILAINSEGEEERVRFLLMDTPETVDPDSSPQPYGKEATDFVKKHLKQGDFITLERYHEKDQYDRTLAHVFVDNIHLNKLLVEEGLARVAFVRDDSVYVNEFKEAENRAKENEKNIWSINGYVTDSGFDASVVD